MIGIIVLPSFSEEAMHSFVEEFAPGVFSPEDVSLLTDAFDDAWRRVQASKAPYAAEEYTRAARTILAKQIINAATASERDPRWLADHALLYLSQQKLARKPPAAFLPSKGGSGRGADAGRSLGFVWPTYRQKSES
jgi:hypothetical protein